MNTVQIKPGQQFIDRRMNAKVTVVSVNRDTDTISLVGYNNHGFLQSADGTYKFSLTGFIESIDQRVHELFGQGEIPTRYFGTSSLN